VMAQPRDGDHDRHYGRDRHDVQHPLGPPHGYPVHPYGDRDIARWRAGGWRHEWHDGRMGWWWVVGPGWYFYPAPIYPFPSPYVPPMIAPPRGPMWYWCAAPAGYYPYVTQCSVPWQAVPPR
jgi:hypothetical protein